MEKNTALTFVGAVFVLKPIFYLNKLINFFLFDKIHIKGMYGKVKFIKERNNRENWLF